MSKTEIIAELAHLSPEDLAEVRAWLDHLPLEKTAVKAEGTQPVRIRTPRLANRAQAGDFIKHVTELRPDAAL